MDKPHWIVFKQVPCYDKKDWPKNEDGSLVANGNYIEYLALKLNEAHADGYSNPRFSWPSDDDFFGLVVMSLDDTVRIERDPRDRREI